MPEKIAPSSNKIPKSAATVGVVSLISLKPARKSGVEASPEVRLALTRAEAAKALGICKRSLKRLEQRGLLVSCKALRTRLYPLSELERFLRTSS